MRVLGPYQQEFNQSVKQGFLEYLRIQERARMDEYKKAREYYDGVHNTQLTDRLREFLHVDSEQDFNANYCPIVVDAKAERLKVIGFSTEDNQNETMWDWWKQNRMDRKQGIVHLAACRDADSFVLVDWDNIRNIPRFNFEPAYCGDGVMVYYSEERRDEIEFASKSWRIRYGSKAGTAKRLNLYFADRIEKYIADGNIAGGRYQPYLEDENAILGMGMLGNAGIVDWTDQRGNPLGIPIVHFKHKDVGDGFGTSALANIFPIQDAVNKALIDLIAASDSDAFRILVGIGTTNWSTAYVGPGSILGIETKPENADIKVIDGADLSGLLAIYQGLVMEIARTSGIPLSYFQISGQVAAEGTMKQQEVNLVSQVEKLQTDYGNSWEDCMILARRLHNTFGEGDLLDENMMLETIWAEAESRNDKEQAETLSIRVEKLGVSKAQAQQEMGYDADERASFLRDSLRNQALAIRNQTIQMQQQQDNTQPDNMLTDTEMEQTPNE